MKTLNLPMAEWSELSMTLWLRNADGRETVLTGSDAVACLNTLVGLDDAELENAQIERWVRESLTA